MKREAEEGLGKVLEGRWGALDRVTTQPKSRTTYEGKVDMFTSSVMYPTDGWNLKPLFADRFGPTRQPSA